VRPLMGQNGFSKRLMCNGHYRGKNDRLKWDAVEVHN
jgi:hypothetical protein